MRPALRARVSPQAGETYEAASGSVVFEPGDGIESISAARRSGADQSGVTDQLTGATRIGDEGLDPKEPLLGLIPSFSTKHQSDD